MKLHFNNALPEIMHCDQNCSFASAHQQQWEFWRGKPVAVTPVLARNGSIISMSYEAKKFGIKVGTKNYEAKSMAPGLILVESKPALYKEIHTRFVNVFSEYTPDVDAISVDEVVINLANTPIRKNLGMEEIGYELKREVKQQVGDSIRINVGIGPNRFYAKLAASLHKPDGLDRIDHTNVREVLSGLSLLDLPGISYGYASQLAMQGITTPLQFLDADPFFLRNQVFHSIVGAYWHQKMHGWEMDGAKHEKKGFTNSHVFYPPSPYFSDILPIVYKLAHKVSFRMRKRLFGCRTVSLYIGLQEGRGVYGKLTLKEPILATREIFPLLKNMFEQHEMEPVNRMGKLGLIQDKMLSAYGINVWVGLDNLVKDAHLQLQLLKDSVTRDRRLSHAEDIINSRFGLYAIGSPYLLKAKDSVPDRIPFGSPQDVKALYEEAITKREIDNTYGDGSLAFDEWQRFLLEPE